MVKPTTFLALSVLVCIAAFAPASAMQAGGAPPPAAETAEPASDWRVEANETVAESNHWRWRLRFLERRGDRLAVGMSYRNGGNTGRPLFLDAGHHDTVALVDEASGARFALVGVTGISGDITAVPRKSSGFAEFVFRFPEGARSVRFTSVWMSMRMAGALAMMPVDFPIALPADAGPI